MEMIALMLSGLALLAAGVCLCLLMQEKKRNQERNSAAVRHTEVCMESAQKYAQKLLDDFIAGGEWEKAVAKTAEEKIAEAVGVGAVVFYYLSNNRIRDINFVMEDALSFDGNTGPYVQYTYARTCSVLSKSEGYDKSAPLTITSDDETSLLKTLSRFEETVREAIAQYEPSIITRYILDVAGAYNRFYHNCSILGAENEAIKNTRLALTEAAKTVLGNAFGLICLAKTEKI
jgi:arginyl-tRNA synthetase